MAKLPNALDNEVLAKVVAHNLCVLVQAHFELRIELDLAPDGPAADVIELADPR